MEMLGPRALNDTRVVYDYIRSELASRFHIGEYLPRRGEPRIVVLAGMSGAGKTSAAAKLAAYAHYTLGHSAALINLDTFRVGALNQARTFADILQLPLCNAYTPAELEAALVVHRNTDVIVIDTPGRNPFKPGEMIELATLLAPLPASRRTYLVASATSKLKDLAEAVSAFKGIGLNGLIFTKLDETRTYGALYSLAALTALPAAYFCSGPRIPQDIEPASTEKLMELLLATA
jgi:flagellar biosynthesis protein FlhF